MKSILLSFLFCMINVYAYCQLEISTGYAVDKNLADGAPLQVAYDFKIGKRLYTKSQVGFKSLRHFDDFVGATLKNRIWEIHQTISFEVIKKRNYTLKPNVGINYRWYKWRGEMVQPLNTLPGRAMVIGVREGNYVLESTSEGYYREYTPNNFGFTFQLQNQFRISEKIWLHITPFLEPDYDRYQNTGGCYIGIILPHFSL